MLLIILFLISACQIAAVADLVVVVDHVAAAVVVFVHPAFVVVANPNNIVSHFSLSN